jgi:hypothetical protein
MFGSLETLAERRRALDAQEARWLRDLLEYERSGLWRADGYLTCAAALRNQCRMTDGAAHQHLDLARKVDALPELAAAFGRGNVSRAHVQVVTKAHTPERADALSEIESTLVEAACEMTPKDLRQLVQHVTDALDGDGGAAHDDSLHARRQLHVWKTIDGLVMSDGIHDPESGEIILTALNAEMERDRCADDPRTLAQRRHDALVNIAQRYLDAGEAPMSHDVRPHVTIVVDLEKRAGPGDLLAGARAEAAHVGHLSQATLERIACDCDITRVVTAGKSEILDVGRASRTAVRAQWAALVVRDRHCRAPGCNAPPWRCQAHHLEHWTRGGHTDLANLILLCWRHHREEHQRNALARAA